MKNLFKILGLAALVAAGASAQASSVILPTANALSAGTYGDFTVYSLDLLQQCQPFDARCRPFEGDKGGGIPQLTVNSQSLTDQLIIYRNENSGPTSNYDSGSGPLANGSLATSGVDNPFDAPTGSGETAFNMSASNEPMTEDVHTTGITPDFTRDLAGTWEAKLSTVQSYIKGSQVVFLFDNNQVGNGVDQEQFFWGQLTILDGSGNAISCFELNSSTNTGCGSVTPTDPTPIFDPTDPTKIIGWNAGGYVGSGGGFCVDKNSGASYLVGALGATHPTTAGQCDHNTGDYFVNNNLGSSSAEFAVTLDALNKNLAAWAAAGYSMSINFKMRNLNDGGEELWICSDCSIGTTTNLPEPATVSLIGLALLGVGAASRRRRA